MAPYIPVADAGKFLELYCQRCPKLQSASDYTLLLVAVSDARRHRSSDLQLLPVSTRDVTPPTFLTAPSVSDIGERNFNLTLSLSEPGKDALQMPLMKCCFCEHDNLAQSLGRLSCRAQYCVSVCCEIHIEGRIRLPQSC